MSTDTILIVDDEPALRFFERLTLEERGIRVAEAASGEEALRLCADDEWAVIVLDHRMPGITGIEVARQLRARGDRTPILLYSGYMDPAVATAAGELGVDMIDKADTELLVQTVLQYAPEG